MKEAVTKVIDTITQEDFHWALQKLLERYNKCIAAGGDYFEGDLSFMCVLSIKVPIRKKSGNLSCAPRYIIFKNGIVFSKLGYLTWYYSITYVKLERNVCQINHKCLVCLFVVVFFFSCVYITQVYQAYFKTG